MAHRMQFTLVYSINISHGSVATSVRCGENFNYYFVANCLPDTVHPIFGLGVVS